MHCFHGLGLVCRWGGQLNAMRRETTASRIDSDRRYRGAPASTRPAAGKGDIALIAYVVRRFDMGHPRWLPRFIYGRPATRYFPQSRLYPPSDAADTSIRDANVLFQPASTRFAREVHLGVNAGLFRAGGGVGSASKDSKDWAEMPILLNGRSLPIDTKRATNPVFRLPVVHPCEI